jgi:mannose-6-phosphate isomerase
LIKFLDAQQSLSVQVHPSAAVARRLGGRVRIKNEAWYVLGVEPDGVIYHGLEPGVTEEGFRSAMTTGRLEGVLRRIPVRPGECYDLPSGTPHALGAGVLVTEVQTPSDVTYRTYDWGRVDPKTGQPRALDLDRAIECIDFTRASPSPQQAVETRTDDGIQIRRLVHCVSFRIEHWRIDGPTDRDVRRGQMAVWILLKGGGTLSTGGRDGDMTFHKGDVLLLPAGLPTSVVRFNGPTALLHVTVPSA